MRVIDLQHCQSYTEDVGWYDTTCDVAGCDAPTDNGVHGELVDSRRLPHGYLPRKMVVCPKHWPDRQRLFYEWLLSR